MVAQRLVVPTCAPDAVVHEPPPACRALTPDADTGWMSPARAQPLPDRLVLSRDCLTSSERSALRTRVQRGELVRVAPGAYCSAQQWSGLGPDERYRLLIRLAVCVDDSLIVSHASAALLWRLPWLGAWPRRVDVAAPAAQGGRATALLARRTTGLPEQTESIDGIRVTTLARTAVDLASRLPFASGVCIVDAVLRRTYRPQPGVPRTDVSLAELAHELPRIPHSHGGARALRVLEFADARADRPGESLSRVTMLRARISPPELQVELPGASGRRYFVDFWWPEFSVFGEFDGIAKYSDPEFLSGRTPERALLDEKYREDDLRAVGRGCARWDWQVAQSVPLLRARLAAAGVR